MSRSSGWTVALGMAMALVWGCGDEETAPTPDATPSDAMIDDAGADAMVPDAQLDAEAGTPEMVVVAVDGTGDYLDLSSALESGASSIVVRPGEYRVSEAVVFSRPNVDVRGEDASTVRFIQTNDDADLFVVRADDVTVSNVTLDTAAVGQAAFVEAGASGVTLQDSIVRGGSSIFAIYFAGPVVTAGAETLDAFSAGELSRGNSLLRNQITSSFVGDSVAFALQVDGVVRENTITGGMLALYMLQDSVCEDNSITDSPTDGIFISLPSTDVTVTRNTVTNAFFSGMVVRPQVEHEAAGRELDSTGIIIEGNTLDAQYFGITVDGTGGDPTQGRLRGLVMSGNTIPMDDFAGIYLLRADEPRVVGNQITFVGSDVSRRGIDGRLAIADQISAAVYLALEVTRPTLEDNLFLREAAATDARVMQNAVVLSEPSVTGAVLRNNQFHRHGDAWVHSPCADDFGDRDHDGVYDLSGGVHTYEMNSCMDRLP